MVGIMLLVTKYLTTNSSKYFVSQQRDIGAVNGYICLLYTSRLAPAAGMVMFSFAAALGGPRQLFILNIPLTVAAALLCCCLLYTSRCV